MSTEIQKSYSRGYNAGLKRSRLNRQREHLRKERQAFWDRAFLSSISACIDVQGWTCGGKPISNIKERVRLAKDFADEALRQRKYIP